MDRVDASVLSEVHLFPNPVDGMLFLDLGNVRESRWEVSVIDVAGRVLSEWTFSAQAVLDLSELVADLPAGVYFLSFAGERGQWFRERIIKR